MGVADLTERERQVWDCRHDVSPPKSIDDTAAELGFTPGTVRSIYHHARERLGLVSYSQERTGNLLESRNPEGASLALEEFATPNGKSVARIAEDLDLPHSTAKALARRLQRDYVSLDRPLGEVKREELRDLFAHTSHRVLVKVTDDDIEKASLKDKLIAASIGVQNFQLLDGEPTEIYSVPELENLDKLAEALLHEVARRKMTATTDPETLDVSVSKDVEVR